MYRHSSTVTAFALTLTALWASALRGGLAVPSLSLEEGFGDPPRSCSLVPFWSWNGRLEPEELRRQIDLMVEQGVYGAFMHARAGINLDQTPYFSEGWWRAIRASVQHAAKVGFAAWIYDEDKWPSGAAGGRTIKRNPKRNVRKGVRWEELRVSGPKEVAIAFPGAHWVLAAKLTGENSIDPDSIVELTPLNAPRDQKRSAGKAHVWTCPPGSWIILAFRVESYGGVNYMNRATVRDFIDITYERYAREVGRHFGKAIPGVFFDEIHNSGVPIVWVENFAEIFKKRKGYDIRRYLPALFMDIGPRTPVVRCDYYDVYTSLYEDAWFKQISQWCAEHNLDLVGHTIENINAYRTQGDYFRTMRHLQIPCTDNEDFRYRYPRRVDPWKPKQLASICHLYGKPFAAVEAMGGAGWSFTLNLARYGHNLLAAYGINFSIPHLFHYAQDRPENVDDWPNSWFFRNPYWKYFKIFGDHARRLTFMLSGTDHVVDVAVLFPQVNLWAGYGGEKAVETIARLVEAPIDVDLIDPDSLLRSDTEGGVIRVERMRYKVLILPGLRCLRRKCAEKILSFVRAGGKVVVEERFPSDSPEVGRDDPLLQEFETELRARGVEPVPASGAAGLVTKLIEPDLVVEGPRPCPLRYHHVRKQGKEIYWIANGEKRGGEWLLSFRAEGVPYLWQPEDGSIRAIGSYLRRNGRSLLSIRLDGWQGVFVVFDPKAPEPRSYVFIRESNLKEPRIVRDGERVLLRGLCGAASARAKVKLEAGGRIFEKQVEKTCGSLPQPITLAGKWSFLPAGGLLDRVWRIDLTECTLEIPVMKIRWERSTQEGRAPWAGPEVDDSRWRCVKIFDSFHAPEGAYRYRTLWEGRFISYYDWRDFKTSFGGKGLSCRKDVDIPPGSKGWIAVVCDGRFELSLGKKTFKAEGPRTRLFRLEIGPEGCKEVSVRAAASRAILLEGLFKSPAGKRIHLFTDKTWEVKRNGTGWKKAWEYVAPPEKPYGPVPYPFEEPEPTVVWYRAHLPPGVSAISVPEIEGSWKAWADGRPLKFRGGKAEVSSPGLLSLRVVLGPKEHGLLKPIRITCKPADLPLGSWTEHNLSWYSGRAIYRKSFNLPQGALGPRISWHLELGRVAWCCEVWVNGKLAGVRVWPPYRLEVTKFLRPGPNELVVVVGNLLANRMRWDIFDDVKGEQWNRKWHDGNIVRDKWCLTSGLLGPVRLVPYHRVEMQLSAR